LHFLNLCTTLTPAAATDRYHNHPASRSLHIFSEPIPEPVKTVDITSPAITEILSSLAAFEDVSAASDASEFAVAKDVDEEVLVKVLPSLRVRIVREDDVKSADDFFETFMESWTRMVGDEVLSKWIVLVLAVSVALNGYLLKGIAAGTSVARPSLPQNVRFGSRDVKVENIPVATSLTTLDQPAKSATETALTLAKPMITVVTEPVAPKPVVASPTPGFELNLKRVDLKLEAQRARESEPSLEPSTLSRNQPSRVTTRSLEECIEIFENGSRPVSASLSLLNDEEVILLAQNGKIAAYALEKVLGDNERAVLIRRALICECNLVPSFA
jgi:hydroxymethylglutaryl-CoA reductase (NADPH)